MLQLVNVKAVMLVPVTWMLVEVMSERVKAEPGLALMVMVPVAARVASVEDTIVLSSAGLPVQEKSKTDAFAIAGQQHRTNAITLKKSFP